MLEGFRWGGGGGEVSYIIKYVRRKNYKDQNRKLKMFYVDKEKEFEEVKEFVNMFVKK